MVAFLREHLFWALLGAYMLGQITTALVLGLLVARDTSVAVSEPAEPIRSQARRPSRRRSAPVTRPVRVSIPDRLRRYLHEVPAELN